jgi:hypothetical protein
LALAGKLEVAMACPNDIAAIKNIVPRTIENRFIYGFVPSEVHQLEYNFPAFCEKNNSPPHNKAQGQTWATMKDERLALFGKCGRSVRNRSKYSRSTSANSPESHKTHGCRRTYPSFTNKVGSTIAMSRFPMSLGRLYLALGSPLSV